MQCENCHAEIEDGSIVCPKCGTLGTQEIQGFENTPTIQKSLRTMFTEHRKNALADRGRFIALLYDYISEYDKELKLLVNMFNADVLKNMVTESNREIAITKAKHQMVSEVFLSEGAAEFVLVCYTYMLGWTYESPMRVITDKEKEEKEKKAAATRKITALDVEMNAFTPIDAAKYRLLGRNIVVPDGVTKIDNFCFDGFGNLRTVILPNSLLAIGNYAFSECKRLREVKLPFSLRMIGQGAFTQCNKLGFIKLPEGIPEIADSTFSFCSSLETVEVPSTVSSIGAEAFLGCERLRKLFLPDSVKFIDNNAFSYCSQLVIRCYENSYVHKYCLATGLPVETVEKGKDLKNNIAEEG